MKIHAESLIEEIEESQANPIQRWIESYKTGRAAKKLLQQHSEALLREVFLALSELDEFPPSILLWNADAPHVPFACFLRYHLEPVFRIISFSQNGGSVVIRVEYGATERKTATRELIRLSRNQRHQLMVLERELIR